MLLILVPDHSIYLRKEEKLKKVQKIATEISQMDLYSKGNCKNKESGTSENPENILSLKTFKLKTRRVQKHICQCNDSQNRRKP